MSDISGADYLDREIVEAHREDDRLAAAAAKLLDYETRYCRRHHRDRIMGDCPDCPA